ncbi:FMN-linked oxidoreductase [Patellaria atrata CBS 101060]|uniref:FMN-linked oxidoreductase n=1 Tax=Patellaria atrata CBS 101060 TaxID=1346257 RepID=A0A9P4VQY7_9PEZI|nr:FMN-linked oxidoreductase [Patellaria atrata CBS 101060]
MPLTIDPPLLNSATPWATDLADLKALYDSPYTGAVTTRTSMLNGFRHNPKHHQYTFFDPSNHAVTPNAKKPKEYATSSLNTLGYSPKRLKEYLVFISQIAKGLGNQVKDATNEGRPVAKAKPFIISVTGTPDEVAECYRLICLHQAMVPMPLAMEVNLSCPNIPGQPPPAYSGEIFPPLTLRSSAPVPIGLKTPPYTQADQFCTLVDELCKSATGSGKRKTCCPISFLTCTNTLGFSLLLDEAGPVLNSLDGSGVGGLGGAALHPLALGNVRTISAALKAHRETRHVRVIGVGGVSDKAGFERMRMAGAGAVGVGTAVGREGVGIFEKIMG